MLEIEIIEDFDRFLELEPVWNKTLTKSDIDIPFLTFEWFECWWRWYENDNALFIILVKEGEEILGIAPLMIKRIKFMMTSLYFSF